MFAGLCCHICTFLCRPPQSCVELEQERQASTASHVEVSSLRQKLRAAAAAAAASISGAAVGAPALLPMGRANSAGVKRPLPFGAGSSRSSTSSLAASAGACDELLEEALADLEQLEAHVAAATQRLVGLQAQNLSLAQDVAASVKSRLQAEERARQEQQAATVGGGLLALVWCVMGTGWAQLLIMRHMLTCQAAIDAYNSMP